MNLSNISQKVIARIKSRFVPTFEMARHQWLMSHIKMKNGVFLEAGANDGIIQSNTLYLERNEGWTGLLVEPLPDAAELCKARRSSPVEVAALVPPELSGQSIKMTHAHLMSIVDAVGDEQYKKAHLSEARQHYSEEFYEFEATGRTLTELLEKHRITHVDLLCLDLEGYEAPALRGLDLGKILPSFILIEARFKADIEAILGGRYEEIGTQPEFDTLYQLRK